MANNQGGYKETADDFVANPKKTRMSLRSSAPSDQVTDDHLSGVADGAVATHT